jgi:hypothetical protein
MYAAHFAFHFLRRYSSAGLVVNDYRLFDAGVHIRRLVLS